MRNTIVFKIDVGDEQSYAAMGNFILKREKHYSLDNKETKIIKYKYYLNNLYDLDTWVKTIHNDIEKFQIIKQPEKISNISDEYDVLYCIMVNCQNDIVELQNLYLLLTYYHKINFIVLCENSNQNFYFKASQYLYTICISNKKFYDRFRCIENGKIQRLQLENIKFSRKFIPLQIIDEDNIKRLFCKCGEILTFSNIEDILSGKRGNTVNSSADVLEGACKILYQNRKQISNIPKTRLYSIIGRMEVFSFVLFCHAIFENKGNINLQALENYAVQMQQYASAIHQLAENIVFHSKMKRGCLTVRIHDSEKEYFENTYKAVEQSEKQLYMEVMVSDFCAENDSGNIAQNFIANIQDINLAKKFNGMMPIDFFNSEQDNKWKNVWLSFYSNPENIGKHFGLKIFQTVLNLYNGFFIAESHQDYCNNNGDSYSTFERNQVPDICLPGTRYRIALPIENIQKAIVKDQSLDSGVDFIDNINEIINCQTAEVEFAWENVEYKSQSEKNRAIMHYGNKIYDLMETEESEVIYMSIKGISNDAGELFAKALVIALFKISVELRLVIYNISSELEKEIFNVIKVFFENTALETMFNEKNIQIILYSDIYEEVVLIPSSINDTNNVNAYIGHMKCLPFREWYIEGINWQYDVKRGASAYIPCDILRDVLINEEKRTIFEHYVYEILNKSIQSPLFGCKLSPTHMRLGSTIHVDQFYEGEIIFGNKLFVSRFALLLLKDMQEKIKNIEKLTLYGYGTYSESVLVQVITMIQQLYPDKRDIDYIILEREEERRGFLHKDRIRYNRVFESDEERKKYFQDRKVVVIVLINSTLKTHVRLISLFKDENDIKESDINWIVKNYAVLLVGTEDKNQYWDLNGKQIIVKNGEILPIPQYMIRTDAYYYEPALCKLCFPDKPINEIPLIEVNAASTIPNQGFGIIKGSCETIDINYNLIEAEEKEIFKVKGLFIYNHVHRNENHFLYYFKTEVLCVREKEGIEQSLKQWKQKWKVGLGEEYNIIVAPMHFSNAGFVELVNNCVFEGNAILLRIDFDKEYRSNAYAKYSYLRNYVKQLCTMTEYGRISVHYVDDSIVSGRTYNRAKSLVKTILGTYKYVRNDSVQIRIFDKVFVLIDRNSTFSQMQYIQPWDNEYDEIEIPNKYFYSYINVNISSLRNYGNSCVFCNMNSETDLLYRTASTAQIAHYWRKYAYKFKLYSLEEHAKKEAEESKEDIRKSESRAYRRLFCTHMAQKILDEKFHGNNTKNAVFLILKLLNTDYIGRETEQYEYFLSYIKCISRPFMVFKKAVKEAIFDIMLLIIDSVIRNIDILKVVKELSNDKIWFKDKNIKKELEILNNIIVNGEERTLKDKRDLVKLIMKELTELKSNYIIRPEKMEAIFCFMMDGDDCAKFQIYYMSLIDRLVGVSSDTNKSIWLDKMVLTEELQGIPISFKVWIILENTRALRDGIEKMYHKRKNSKEFLESANARIAHLMAQYDYVKAEKLLDDFIRKYEKELHKDCSKRKNSAIDEIMEQKIWRFLSSLPILPRYNLVSIAESLYKSNKNWYEILMKEKQWIEEELDGYDIGAKDSTLKELINEEINIYQYSNFKYLLNTYKCVKDEEINDSGIDLIACWTRVLEICRNKENQEANLLQQVGELATLFKFILRVDKVQIIAEKQDENNLDEWKNKIEEDYNKLVGEYNTSNSSDEQNRIPEIRIYNKKHYVVIAEKAGGDDYSAELDEITEDYLDKLEETTNDNKGYLLAQEEGMIIWKLDSGNRGIWINIANNAWKSQREDMQIEMAYTFRRIMLFYQELRKEIFSPEKDDFMNEIYQIRKSLNIYKSNKIYTHTKADDEDEQFKAVVDYFAKDKTAELDLQSYPSQVLKLIADINVSRYYRNGLQKQLYMTPISLHQTAKWGDFKEIFTDGREYIYCNNDKERVTIILKIDESLKENDDILCSADDYFAQKEFALLLYALVLNAAEKGRGKREAQRGSRDKNKKNSIQKLEKSVIVKMAKESGNLIIVNELENDIVDTAKIRRELRRVPESEEDGISFWSINCYIKRCIYAYIQEKIIEEKEKKLEEKEIRALGNRIQDLLGESYEIQPSVDERNGKHYFKVGLPVLMERYRWDIKE